MSCSYADGLSPYADKGKLGLEETVDPQEVFDKKIKTLCQWIESAKHVVVHTGAGISTSAGIPDFRGPNGVWTLEKKGVKPKINVSFDDAKPTYTHMALTELVNQGKIHYIVSQNIDALHLKTGLKRKYLAELHGNMFVDQCNKCERQFVRKTATNSVGQKNLNIPCPYPGLRPCRGTLHDTILDWEHNLPHKDINMGDYNSSIADLSICMGTTLQINPSGQLPLYTKKYNQGKLVICNLSKTKHDNKADLNIRGYVDNILKQIMKHFDLKVPEYKQEIDPTKYQNKPYEIEWTIDKIAVEIIKKRYEDKMKENKQRKKNMKEELKEEKEIIEEEIKGFKRKRNEDTIKTKIKIEEQEDKKEINIKRTKRNINTGATIKTIKEEESIRKLERTNATKRSRKFKSKVDSNDGIEEVKEEGEEEIAERLKEKGNQIKVHEENGTKRSKIDSNDQIEEVMEEEKEEIDKRLKEKGNKIKDHEGNGTKRSKSDSNDEIEEVMEEEIAERLKEKRNKEIKVHEENGEKRTERNNVKKGMNVVELEEGEEESVKKEQRLKKEIQGYRKNETDHHTNGNCKTDENIGNGIDKKEEKENGTTKNNVGNNEKIEIDNKSSFQA